MSVIQESPPRRNEAIVAEVLNEIKYLLPPLQY